MSERKEKAARWFKPALIVTSAVLLVVALGYLWFDYRFPSWKEEVLLPDGRMIVVKQRRDFIEGYGTRKTWLTFSLPEMGGERTWAEYMQPVLLAVSEEGEVFVVGWPTGDKQLMRYEHPRYGYVAFRWSGDHFLRVPFLSVPEPLRKEENIVRCIPGEARFISLQKKNSMGCNNFSDFVVGVSKEIDLKKMHGWALRQAKRYNIEPLSE